MPSSEAQPVVAETSLLVPVGAGVPAAPSLVEPLDTGLWTRDFALLLVSQVLYFVGVYLLLPTLPLFAVALGGGEGSVGLVLGAFTFTAMFVRPFTGWALDAYGRRVVLVVGLVVTLGTILAHELVAGIGLLLALRLLHGVGFGLETTAAGTLTSDLAPKSRLGEGMGYLTLAMGLPMAVAPALGLALSSEGDFTSLFLLAAGLTGLALVLSASMRVPKIERRVGGMSVRTLFERSSLMPAISVMLLTMTYAPILAFIALYGEERGIGNVGWFFAVFAVVLAVVRPVSGRLADRWGYLRTATLGWASVVAGLLALALASDLFVLLLAGVLYGAGYGTSQPSLQALTVRGVAPGRRGAANATFFFAYDLGLALGSIGGGFLASWLTLGGLYWAALVPAGAAIVLQTARLRAASGRIAA
jgi:MFS family permease